MCVVYDYEKEYKLLLARRPDYKQLHTWASGVVLAVRILRLRIGTLRLDNLKPRQWRYLTTQEVAALQKLVKRKR